MKVGEQAVYLARLKGLSKEEAVSRLQAWFEKFGIMPWWNRKLEELAERHGTESAVHYPRLLHNPDLLIFDEPFSGFDPVNAEQLKQEILQLKEQGHTIIFSTHNMASVEAVCDDIALINHSEVVLHGEMRQIKDQFRTGLYELDTPQTLTKRDGDLFSVVSHETQLGVEHYLLQAKEGITGNELVKQLCDEVEVQSFAEQIPSMNDIFLKVIGKDTKWNEEQIESES